MSAKPGTLRAIDALSVVMLLAAAAISLWPIHVDTTPSDSRQVVSAASARAVSRDTNVVVTTDASDVIEFNILSSSRKAPKVRYTSPELMAQTPYTPPPAFAPATDNASTAGDSTGANDADPVPALYGIANIDGTWRALLRLTVRDVSPVLLKEGDKRGPYRVVSIAADRVVVATADGQRILRLSRAARADSTKIKP